MKESEFHKYITNCLTEDIWHNTQRTHRLQNWCLLVEPSRVEGGVAVSALVCKQKHLLLHKEGLGFQLAVKCGL